MIHFHYLLEPGDQPLNCKGWASGSISEFWFGLEVVGAVGGGSGWMTLKFGPYKSMLKARMGKIHSMRQSIFPPPPVGLWGSMHICLSKCFHRHVLPAISFPGYFFFHITICNTKIVCRYLWWQLSYVNKCLPRCNCELEPPSGTVISGLCFSPLSPSVFIQPFLEMCI